MIEWPRPGQTAGVRAALWWSRRLRADPRPAAAPQGPTEAALARVAARLADESAARGGGLETLRGALAGRPALIDEAGRLPAAAASAAAAAADRAGALLAEGSTALWARLEEGLREWRAAASAQGDRVVALRAEMRCGARRCGARRRRGAAQSEAVAAAGGGRG